VPPSTTSTPTVTAGSSTASTPTALRQLPRIPARSSPSRASGNETEEDRT
jgi:hypothetical protein